MASKTREARVTDLEGEFSGVAEHHHVALPGHGGELVEGGEHEHGRLAHTGLGLGR